MFFVWENRSKIKSCLTNWLQVFGIFACFKLLKVTHVTSVTLRSHQLQFKFALDASFSMHAA